MPILLKDMDFKWFKNHAWEFYCWRKFLKEFKRHFRDDDHDRRVHEQIHSCTQGKEVTIHGYLTNVQGLNNLQEHKVPAVEQ